MHLWCMEQQGPRGGFGRPRTSPWRGPPLPPHIPALVYAAQAKEMAVTYVKLGRACEKMVAAELETTLLAREAASLEAELL